MKAELAGGEIVPLEKDCRCITHNGPHWVHMDDVTRSINTEPKPTTWLGLVGMAKEELVRLAEKRQNFERLGIVRLIREDTDELSAAQKRKLERHHKEIVREIQAKEERQRPKSVRETRNDRRRRKQEVRTKAKQAL